jgi:hypothetical protein
VLGSPLVRDPEFQDHVAAETRALLSTVSACSQAWTRYGPNMSFYPAFNYVCQRCQRCRPATAKASTLTPLTLLF